MTERKTLQEAAFIFLGTLISIKILYEFRDAPFLGEYLSTFVALLLIYPPILHTTLRKIPITFFERGPALRSSLLLFFIASLLIFPPFLGLNHLYQRIFLDASFHPSFPKSPLELITVQLFLVAFPEEFFFRGYLQTLIRRRFPWKIAIPIASLLFAASHSLIALQWWHFAIFFPSLVFGWLREKTGGLVAPILFHALSNVIVHWIGVVYR